MTNDESLILIEINLWRAKISRDPRLVSMQDIFEVKQHIDTNRRRGKVSMIFRHA